MPAPLAAHFTQGVLVCALSAAALLATPTHAADKNAAVQFEHKDWALQCDNTRTCRAVGYQAEAGDSEPVSVLLTREAGPDTPVQV